jgi:hypothetical protein
MARWPSLLAATAALTATVPLWAQPNGKPAAPVAVDPARVFEAMDVCRQAPPSYAEAFRYAREQGFGDLPPEVRARIPVETLVRNEVSLRVESSFMAGEPGNCTVYATIGDGHGYDEIVAALAARFGRPGEQGDGQAMHWEIEGRYINASLRDNYFEIFVRFPELTPEQVAAARAAEQARRAEALARLTAATGAASEISPAADIAAAATLCVAAVAGSGIDADSLQREGWTRGDSGRASYARPGINARIFAGGSQCVVDAYGETAGSFDAIRDAIRDQLRARFGRDVRLAGATGEASAFSRGQGYVVGDRMGILSSERRPNGLSIRFTVMSLR